MHEEGIAARQTTHTDLRRALLDAHARTWGILADLTPERWEVPYHAGINPPRWEYGHVAWFTEWWVLREARWNARDELTPQRASMLPGVDDWFDSSRIAHADRWTLAYPSIAELRDYADRVLAGVLEKLSSSEAGDLYFGRLALFHEDMHGEALTYMRQTLSYPSPWPLRLPVLAGTDDDIAIPGGVFLQGTRPDGDFVFDNEKWAHEVRLAPARISRQCVSNAAYAEFVEAGGYRDQRWWSDEGHAWLEKVRLDHPQRWRRTREGWEHCWFGRWETLPLDQPVCHVNAFEAEAWCRWARRRLPTEAEWERAATLGLIDWGSSVWEWTANPFAPYAGFSPDPYRDYSQPWFHSHRSVRGGSLVTQPRMHHARYRNFYLPHRNDIFVGFRSCAA